MTKTELIESGFISLGILNNFEIAYKKVYYDNEAYVNYWLIDLDGNLVGRKQEKSLRELMMFDLMVDDMNKRNLIKTSDLFEIGE